MRHPGRFREAFADGIGTGLELVFEARNLPGDRDFLLHDVPFPANTQGLGIDEVVKDQVTFRSGNDPFVGPL